MKQDFLQHGTHTYKAPLKNINISGLLKYINISGP